MIDHPLADLDAWVEHYSQADLPILLRTTVELDKLQVDVDKVNGRNLAQVILSDPLMTLRVLSYLEKRRHKSQQTDIVTIDRALVMMGIGPFFRDFAQLPTLEESLKAHPQALLGALKVITRARKATHWARDWAIYRHDLDIEEITVATLLHDSTELLMWCFAPSLMQQVAALQKAQPGLRSALAQQEVFGFALEELQKALIQAWHLPQLLTQLLDPASSNNPRLQNITLAVDLARHSAKGWKDPALPDDLKALSELLHVNQETVLRRLGVDPAELA